MPDLGHSLPERDHARLDTDGLQLRAAELVRAAGQLGVVDRLVDGHFPAVDLEDLGPRLLVRERELDLAVQAARPQEGRVEHVDAVRGGEDFDAVVRGEAVELVEQFQHGPLHLSVPALFAVKPFGADGVELVDEDY